MIYQDQKREHDRELAMTEYMAAFWNPEAVKKIQQTRTEAAKHKFKSDTEFEESIISGDYKNNPILEAVKQLGLLNDNKKVIPEKPGKSKSATNLANLKQTIESFK